MNLEISTVAMTIDHAVMKESDYKLSGVVILIQDWNRWCEENPDKLSKNLLYLRAVPVILAYGETCFGGDYAFIYKAK